MNARDVPLRLSTKSRFQFSLRSLLILTAVVALVVGVIKYLTRDEYGIVTFDCGAGRQIVITAEAFWEVSQPIRYHVIVDGVTVVPTCSFHYAFPDERLRFELVTAEENEVVGVVLVRDNGKELVILHDFATDESWPALCAKGAPSRGPLRLRRAFQRLQAENPDIRLSKFS